MLKSIPRDSKIVIRFPDDFVEEFDVTGCEAINGFSFVGDIDCIYVKSVRLLTIDGGFPATFTELIFDVKGITNPEYAAPTDYFKVNSYKRTGGEFITLEQSTPVIFVNPQAGALSNESLSLQDSTVGVFS